MKKLITVIAVIGSFTAFGQTAQDYYNNGTDKAKSQDFAGSIKEFDKAIKLDPNNTSAYYNRGTSEMYVQDFKNAVKDFDKAIKLKPDFVNAYTNRVVAKLKLNDTKGAIQDFDSTIHLDPKNASAFFMRGQVKLQTQDIDGGCSDLSEAKGLGDSRADKFLQQYCGNKSASTSQKKAIESLMIDWPDSEGWRIASNQDNSEQNMIELLRNKETFDNWTEIGTMFVYKNVGLALNVPITKTMDATFEQAKKDCGPSAKLTMLEKDEKAKYPWIIFKIECSSPSGTESQVWYAIQGTDELFVNFRAVKKGTVPHDLQDKWVSFFKTAKIVIQ